MSRFLNWKSSKKPTGSVVPSSREGHSLTYIPSLDALAMFGGCSHNKNSDLLLYRVSTSIWERHQPKGAAPSARCFHCATYNERFNALIVVGGYTAQNISVNDVYFLLLDTWTWKMFRSVQSFPKRHHFSMIPHGDSLILFGGISRPSGAYFNDMWAIDLKKCTFGQDHYSQGVKTNEVAVVGTPPMKRYGHQSLFRNDCMLVFGGFVENGDSDSNIYSFEFITSRWNTFQPTLNPLLTNRAFSMMMRLSEETILVFGGISTLLESQLDQTAIFQMDSMSWSIPYVAGHRPQNRCYCSSSQIGNSLFIIGGINEKYCSMELLELQYVEGPAYQDWLPITRPSDAQVKAFGVLSSSIVAHNYDIITLEWAIREQMKITKQLQAAESNCILQKKAGCIQSQKRLYKQSKLQRQRREKQLKFENEEKLLNEFLSMERRRVEGFRKAMSIQQELILTDLALIQKLRNKHPQVSNIQAGKVLTKLKNQIASLLKAGENGLSIITGTSHMEIR